MSLFDPLYQIEEQEPPSLDEINQALKEFDGSGSGLMTARQLYAACQSMKNLGFTEQELQNYIKEAQDISSDGNGKIKTAEFAPYIAVEAKKNYKKKNGNSNNTSNGQQKQQNGDYVNPFADFLSGPDSGQSPPKQMTLKNTPSMKITLTADPSGHSESGEKVDMTPSYSPTEQDATELPTWFGHSVNTITTHPNQPSTAADNDPFGFFGGGDDQKSNTNGNLGAPNHISIPTQDILFADDDNTSNGDSSGVDKKRNLSPTRAKSLKKHGASKSSAGLIAPPRAKGDKTKAAKKRKSGKTKGGHSSAISASFTNNFGDFADDYQVPDNQDNKLKAKNKLKLKKAHSEMVPESSHKLQSRADKAAKKKRPKIDAIVEMKRGTAMLKYGRRGFPHFRRFQISHDLTKLLWYSRKKSLNETHVAVAEMKDILQGQQTEVFKQCTQKTLEKASFSIIYGTKLKSLDVVAKSAEEAQLWIKGLKGLIKANQQGKLHKVVQILVDVDFKDISKTKYRTCTDDERRKFENQHKNRSELVHTITTTLQQSRKIFQSLVKISNLANVQNSNEYVNIQTLTSEIEERLEEIEFGLENKTADLTDLKRDVWVLKVDVTVLEEKVKVLSKIKTSIPI